MKRFVPNSILILFVTAALFFLSAPVARAQENGTPVRVGFPIQQGLTMIDQDGSYSGYTYDYLKELAQYTGWTYEFVTVDGTINEQLIRMMEMLADGEIDILGAMSYNDRLLELYDYPSSNYGNAYYVIAVRNDEDRIDEYNLPEYKHLRMALLKQAKNSNEKFFQYAKLNGIDYEIIWCADEKERDQKVLSGEADALVSVDLSLDSSLRPVAKFSPTPFYFATTKGNTAIVNGLSQAITYINDINPMLQTDLYNKYFFRTSSQLILNTREKAYVQEHPVLKVLVHDGFGPLQYYGSDGKVYGVSKDLLSNIARKAGWEIEYIYTDTYEEYARALSEKTADLILSVPYDYDTALKRDILLSIPYLETESVTVVHEGIAKIDSGKQKKAVYLGDRIEDEDSDNIAYYDSVEAALQAVERGECDYTMTNSYTASYYQRKNRHRHTVIYPMAGDNTIKYSLGILHKSDKLLSAILNKGVNSIDPSELESYIYDNAQHDQVTSFKTFVADNPFSILGGFLFIALILLALFYNYHRVQMKMAKELELENTRYRYLSDIMKEVTFTYDYRKDILFLSQEGIRFFDTDEKITDYSHYLSKVTVDSNTPSLYVYLEPKKDITTEILLKPEGPSSVPEWYRVIVKVVRDGNEAVSAIGRIQNIHKEKLEKERLMQQSRTDGLTGLYNSATVKQEISKMLQNPAQGPYALFILDIDGFKEINDRYGHYIGDQVLIQLAAALNDIFSDNAVAGRLGGDEFVAFARYPGREWAVQKCRALSENLASRCIRSHYPVSTVSIGVSPAREADDFISLYQRTDAVLYEVKNTGKNDYRIEE